MRNERKSPAKLIFRPTPTGLGALVRLRIKELRNRRGWSMRELARRAGMRYATVHALEHGADPQLSTLEKLARAFDVKVTALLREE